VIYITDRQDSIKALLEVLESLRIIKEYTLEGNRTIELVTPETEEISTALALVVYNRIEQAVMLKSMIPDPGWFDSNQMKFENWWREIRLFLKINRVIETDNKITEVLA